MNAMRQAIPVALGLASALAGCMEPAVPPPRINYYVVQPHRLERVNRVAFVALTPEAAPEDVALEMSEAIETAIQRHGVFHVQMVSPDDPVYQELGIGPRTVFSMRQLVAVRDALDCDAVLIGSVERFQPYPRMQIGLYVRLLDLRNGRLAWAVDHVWDTNERETELRIRRFVADHRVGSCELDNWRLATMSPKAFVQFVADELAGTLPGAQIRKKDGATGKKDGDSGRKKG